MIKMCASIDWRIRRWKWKGMFEYIIDRLNGENCHAADKQPLCAAETVDIQCTAFSVLIMRLRDANQPNGIWETRDSIAIHYLVSIHFYFRFIWRRRAAAASLSFARFLAVSLWYIQPRQTSNDALRSLLFSSQISFFAVRSQCKQKLLFSAFGLFLLFPSRAEWKNTKVLMFCSALDISLAAKCDKHSLAIAEPRTTEYIAFRLNERRDKSARAQLTHRLQSVGRWRNRNGERREENAKY